MAKPVRKRQANKKSGLRFYIITSLVLLLTLGMLAAGIIFRQEIRHLGAYGYIGVFIIGVLGGISIIPAPTMAMVFFLGGTLDPVWVGISAAVGGAIGGITVYMTGTGMETIWSRFRRNGEMFEKEPGWRYDPVRPVESRVWSRGERLYAKLSKWMEGRGGYWTLFITAGIPGGPYYFAGLAAGSLRMGLLKFITISLAGKIIRYLMVSYAGYLGLYVLLRWIGG